MPAMNCCCRRWRAASDEFVWYSIVGWILTLPIIALTHTLRVHYICSSVAVDVAAWSSTVMGALLVILALSSARGSIKETSKRPLVPWWLWAVFLTSLIEEGALVALYTERGTCGGGIPMIIVALALTTQMIVVEMGVLLMSCDFSGPSSHRTWYRRLRCCMFWMPQESALEKAFEEAASVMSVVFADLDYVPSDITAGLLLIHGFQQRKFIRTTSVLDFGGGKRERIDTQARRFVPLTTEQQAKVVQLIHYAPFYMGSYGCLLQMYMRPVTTLPRLCCCTPCPPCASMPSGVHGCCQCDTAALMNVTGLTSEDVVHSSFVNELYRPCFYVAHERDSGALLIVVRGSMSMVDALTDVVARAEAVDVAGVPNARCHGGMLRSAEYVLGELDRVGITNRIVNGDWKTKPLVVLGHSLGAGVAIISSIVLHNRHADLRPRLTCLAYSPPGGLLSPSLAEYARDFVLGCLVGNDIVPRLSVTSVVRLRDSIVAAVEHAEHAKCTITAKCCCTDKLSLPTTVDDDTDPRSPMRRPPLLSGEEYGLVPPLQIVHFLKAAKGGGICGGKDIYFPLFIDPATDLKDIVVSSRMLLDHFPDFVRDTLVNFYEDFCAGRLDRFAPPLENDGGGWKSSTSLKYSPKKDRTEQSPP